MSLYLERCKTAAASIDSDTLAELSLGELGGRTRSSEFRRLGQLSVFNTSQAVGLKIPAVVGTSELRVVEEVSFIDLVVRISPQIMSYVPSFLSLIRVENSRVQAVLTEDVTMNGLKEIKEMPASAGVRSMIYKPFANLGPESYVLDMMTFNETLAFDIEGTERLLDFTPPPLILKFMDTAICKESKLVVREVLDDITINVPFESDLGEALRNYAS